MAIDYPYYHQIIDNFLDLQTAKSIEEEFPDYNSSCWFEYNNPLEVKRACNSWYHFGSETYKLFSYLNSPTYIEYLKKITGIKDLYPDIGLHGGGLHMMGTGGKLNIHLDYSLHPKLKLQRKLNLILYLTEDWDSKWGGNLELWSHDSKKNKPKEKIVTVNNIFNRAILFDTTQNSWHGFSDPIICPEHMYRKSIAVYYLTTPPENVDKRARALYAPTKEQEDKDEIIQLIQNRADLI